jgi:hypothetical protein
VGSMTPDSDNDVTSLLYRACEDMSAALEGNPVYEGIRGAIMLHVRGEGGFAAVGYDSPQDALADLCRGLEQFAEQHGIPLMVVHASEN